MGLFKKKKKEQLQNDFLVTDDLLDDSTNAISDGGDDSDNKGQLDEKITKQIADSDVADDGTADEMPTANQSGRDTSTKKKLQLAIASLVGLLIMFVGVGLTVSKYSDKQEEARVKEAEEAAQKQKQVANGSVDLSSDMAAVANEPPPLPAGAEGEFEDDLEAGAMDTTPTATPTVQPLPPEPAYIAPTPTPRYESDTMVSGRDYTPPAPMPAPAPIEPMGLGVGVAPEPTIIEHVPPPVKGSNSPVLVDVNAVRAVSLSGNSGNNNQVTSQGQGNQEQGEQARVGGNLNPTVLANSKAARRDDTSLMLLKGAIIPCVLKTKIDSTYQGFTVCQISRDVYSTNGKTLLIERGSNFFGEQNIQLNQGQARVSILWTRVETPRGVSVNLDSPATGQLGEMGVSAKVKNHFGKRFGGAIMLSLIQDAISAGTTHLEKDKSKTGQTTIENTSSTAESIAEKALENSINISPTATVNQGTVINIMVARDVDFSSVYGLKKK